MSKGDGLLQTGNLAVRQCMSYYRQSRSAAVHGLLQTVLQCGSACVITDNLAVPWCMDQPLILIVDMGLGLWTDGPSPSVFFLE